MACNSRVLWPTIQHEALEHGEAIEAAGGDEEGVNGDITDLQSAGISPGAHNNTRETPVINPTD